MRFSDVVYVLACFAASANALPAASVSPTASALASSTGTDVPPGPSGMPAGGPLNGTMAGPTSANGTLPGPPGNGTLPCGLLVNGTMVPMIPMNGTLVPMNGTMIQANGTLPAGMNATLPVRPAGMNGTGSMGPAGLNGTRRNGTLAACPVTPPQANVTMPIATLVSASAISSASTVVSTTSASA